jgi:hypothetical protein
MVRAVVDHFVKLPTVEPVGPEAAQIALVTRLIHRPQVSALDNCKSMWDASLPDTPLPRRIFGMLS